ncbi:MAG: DUF349 domain-containing protein [Muribaculaceae bacterium]|nr:DUF349 domain-containing protein [Muribaculaceae bacterium]
MNAPASGYDKTEEGEGAKLTILSAMNELDKQTSPVDDVNISDAALVSEAPETPAEPIMESAATEDTPVEENATIEVSEESDTTLSEANRQYHSMTKPELIDALQAIVDSGNLEAHKEVALIKQVFYSIQNKEITAEMEAFIAEGNNPEDFSSTPDESEGRIKNLLAEFKEKRNAYLEKKEEERQQNLEKKKGIIAELKAIAEDIDNINLHFQKFQQLQQDFKSVGEVPAGYDNDTWKEYQSAVELFYDRLKMNKELRDLDFKKNLELKTILVEKAQELATLPDPVEAFRRLQVLHDQFREIGPVAREMREEIWNKFKDASTVVNKRHQDYFQARKAAEQENESAKTILCEKAEAIDYSSLKTFAEWEVATKEFLALQQEWKGLGFASRKANNQLFARFRKACDDFFTAKGEHFRQTKEELKDNLLKKEALCEKAEALKENFNEKGALDKMQALQKEWRTIGVVKRKQGDEVWKRFCAAVDAFYDARKKLFSGRRDEESENLKAKREVIEKLKAIPEDAERKDVIETIRTLQNEWQKIGHVPFKQKDTVAADYRKELDRLFGAFDLQQSRQRMRKFEGDVKKMEGDETKRERDRLVRAIENRQAELKTIENNLGFFSVKSSAGNSMMKEFERKMQRIKDDINQIREKIAFLDKQKKENQGE